MIKRVIYWHELVVNNLPALLNLLLFNSLIQLCLVLVKILLWTTSEIRKALFAPLICCPNHRLLLGVLVMRSHNRRVDLEFDRLHQRHTVVVAVFPKHLLQRT